MTKLTPIQYAMKRRRAFLVLGLMAFNLVLIADVVGDIAIADGNPEDFELSLMFKAMYASAALVLWFQAFQNHRLINKLKAGPPKTPPSN